MVDAMFPALSTALISNSFNPISMSTSIEKEESYNATGFSLQVTLSMPEAKSVTLPVIIIGDLTANTETKFLFGKGDVIFKVGGVTSMVAI